MKYALLLLILACKPANAGWFKNFCERHLIANDPSQYEESTNIELLEKFNYGPSSEALIREMFYRLNWDEKMTNEERELFEGILIRRSGE